MLVKHLQALYIHELFNPCKPTSYCFTEKKTEATESK